MEFSGAMNPLVYIQDGELNLVKGTRRGIGGTYLFNRKEFENHIIDISNSTTFYLFTDGYQDQFGGMDQGGKKFMARRFREVLKEVHRLPMETQMNVLKDRHKKWKKGYHQTDDILVFGGKVS
jgi:serine phosphatase RsbU (regulator of sigma subunit)